MLEQNSEIQKHFQELATKWQSTFVSRDQVEIFTGGIISPGRMANLDCLGEGPKRIRIGRKIAYPVKSLIQWLSERTTSVPSNKMGGQRP